MFQLIEGLSKEQVAGVFGVSLTPKEEKNCLPSTSDPFGGKEEL